MNAHLKIVGMLALGAYFLLLSFVVYGNLVGGNDQMKYGDAAGVGAFIVMCLYIFLAGMVVPTIYLNQRYQSTTTPPNPYSPATWVIGLSLLLLSMPSPLTIRNVTAPRWVSYPIMIIGCTVASCGFMIITFVLALVIMDKL